MLKSGCVVRSQFTINGMIREVNSTFLANFTLKIVMMESLCRNDRHSETEKQRDCKASMLLYAHRAKLMIPLRLDHEAFLRRENIIL